MHIVVAASPLVAYGIRWMLEEVQNISVIGESCLADELIAMCIDLTPEVVLIDATTTQFSIPAVAGRIASALPHTVIMALVDEQQSDSATMLDASVTSFLPITIQPRELRYAIMRSSAHKAPLDFTDDRKVVREACHHSLSSNRARLHEHLSRRETEVLACTSQGMKNSAIALKLGIGQRTVKGYMESILAKLGASSRTEAVVIALKRGYIEVGLGRDPTCAKSTTTPSLAQCGLPRDTVALSQEPDLAHRHSNLLDEIDVGCCLIQNERYLYVNKTLGRMLGYDPGELIGMHLSRIVDPQLRQATNWLHRVRLAGQAVPTEYSLPLFRKDGTSFLATIHVRVILHEGKTAVTSVVSDARRDMLKGHDFQIWLREHARSDSQRASANM